MNPLALILLPALLPGPVLEPVLATQQRTAPLLAAVQSDALGRALLIAALVVSPYVIYKLREVRRVRAAHARAVAADATDTAGVVLLPALEDVIGDISYVVAEARLNGGAMLLVPHQVTVSDRPATDAVVDMLVRDALRRSGLVVTAELDTAEGRLLECASGGGVPDRDPTDG